MATILSKPGTVSSTANPGGTKIGASGTIFYIHVWDIEHDYWSPVQETSGDGDANPVIQNNLKVYGRILLHGAMVASQALGLAKLVDTNNGSIQGNGVAIEGVVLRHDSGREITVNMVVERIRVRHRKNSAYNAVSMICHVTNTDLTAAES